MDGDIIVKDEPPDGFSCVGSTGENQRETLGRYPWLHYSRSREDATGHLTCWPCSQVSPGVVKFPLVVKLEELAFHESKDSHTSAVMAMYPSFQPAGDMDGISLQNGDDTSSSQTDGVNSSPESGEEDKDQPKYEYQKKKRRFCQHWLLQFPWLMYEEEKNRMFCKLCIKYSSGSSSRFVKGGNDNFKVGAIHSHTICKDHQRAIKADKSNQEVHLYPKSKFLLDKYLLYFPWLSYKAGANVLTCSVCQEHGTRKMFLPLETGQTYQHIKCHSQRKDHLDAEKKEIDSWEEAWNSQQDEEVQKSGPDPDLAHESIQNGGADAPEAVDRNIKREIDDVMEFSLENVPSQDVLIEQPKAEMDQELMPNVQGQSDEATARISEHLIGPDRTVIRVYEHATVREQSSEISHLPTNNSTDSGKEHPALQMVIGYNRSPSGCSTTMGTQRRCQQGPRSNLTAVFPVFGTFQEEWLTSFPWLKYDKASNAMKCMLCAKHDKKNLLAGGTRVFKRSCLSEHALSVKHCEALKVELVSGGHLPSAVPVLIKLGSVESNSSSEDSGHGTQDVEASYISESGSGTSSSLNSAPDNQQLPSPQVEPFYAISILPRDDIDNLEQCEQRPRSRSRRTKRTAKENTEANQDKKKRREFLPVCQEFLPIWQEGRSWLSYDPEADLMYCEWCKEMGNPGPFSEGTDNFDLCCIGQHSQTQDHKNARVKCCRRYT